MPRPSQEGSDNAANQPSPSWLLSVVKVWSQLVVIFTDVVARPMYDAGDDPHTLHRKNIFSYASVFYVLEGAAVVALIDSIPNDASTNQSNCDSGLGYAAIMGCMLTMLIYAYARIQQTCFDAVVALQFLQTSVQQFVFTLFMPSSNVCVGAISIIAASLLYAACRLPLAYHVLPVVASFFVFGSAIADVSYKNGFSSAYCEREFSPRLMLPIAVVMMAQFYAVVGMTSVSKFVVSLYQNEDMRGFFSLRMANVVLGLVAGLNFDIAYRVLDVCRHDVTEDLHGHLVKIVASIQRYVAYVPPSVLRPNAAGGRPNETSLLMSTLAPMMQLMNQRSSDNANPGFDMPGAMFPNPLFAEAHRERSPPPGEDEGPTALDMAAGQVIATLFSDHRGSGASSTAVAVLQFNQNHLTQRQFESKSATVLRVGFCLAGTQRTREEVEVFRSVMLELVRVCEAYHGEIEEATSTFVLISFGVRFHQAHEQVAVDCAVALYAALTTSVFGANDLHIAIVSGEIVWGTYVTSEKSFVVIGGLPVETATKLNTLQEQIQAPIVATTDTVSHCRNTFIPIDLCRPAGHVQALQVFELIQHEISEDVKMVMSEAVSLLARGERMIPEALTSLADIKDVCPQAARLARLLSKLPPDLEYCKDEVPWVSNADQIMTFHPILQHAVTNSNNASGMMMSPDGQPQSLLDNSVYNLGLGAGAGDTMSMASGSTRHGGTSLFGGEDDVTEDSDEVAEHHDPLTLQQWQLGDTVSDGNTCTVIIALGSAGTIGAAIRYKNLNDLDHAPREHFILNGSGRVVARQVARLYAVVADTTPGAGEDDLLTVVEYFPQGSLKQFMRDYSGATLLTKTWVNYVREIVRGAAVLNNQWKIVHGCIRPSCVLLGDDSRCALTKYGMVPPHKQNPDHMFYAAPELVLTDSKRHKKDVDVLTSALDVWSIGITALELAGCQNPIRGLAGHDPQKCIQVFNAKRGVTQATLSESVRNEMRGAPSQMVEFVLRCIIIEPQDRIQLRDAFQFVNGVAFAQDM